MGLALSRHAGMSTVRRIAGSGIAQGNFEVPRGLLRGHIGDAEIAVNADKGHIELSCLAC